jgi:hypothetical protein
MTLINNLVILVISNLVNLIISINMDIVKCVAWMIAPLWVKAFLFNVHDD